MSNFIDPVSFFGTEIKRMQRVLKGQKRDFKSLNISYWNDLDTLRELKAYFEKECHTNSESKLSMHHHEVINKLKNIKKKAIKDLENLNIDLKAVKQTNLTNITEEDKSTIENTINLIVFNINILKRKEEFYIAYIEKFKNN